MHWSPFGIPIMVYHCSNDTVYAFICDYVIYALVKNVGPEKVVRIFNFTVY